MLIVMVTILEQIRPNAAWIKDDSSYLGSWVNIFPEAKVVESHSQVRKLQGEPENIGILVFFLF